MEVTVFFYTHEVSLLMKIPQGRKGALMQTRFAVCVRGGCAPRPRDAKRTRAVGGRLWRFIIFTCRPSAVQMAEAR